MPLAADSSPSTTCSTPGSLMRIATGSSTSTTPRLIHTTSPCASASPTSGQTPTPFTYFRTCGCAIPGPSPALIEAGHRSTWPGMSSGRSTGARARICLPQTQVRTGSHPEPCSVRTRPTQSASGEHPPRRHIRRTGSTTMSRLVPPPSIRPIEAPKHPGGTSSPSIQARRLNCGCDSGHPRKAPHSIRAGRVKTSPISWQPESVKLMSSMSKWLLKGSRPMQCR